MYQKDEEIFESPDEEAHLWRYMDFTKFVSLIAREELFFSRADKLGDPFEGSLPKGNIKGRADLLKLGIPQMQSIVDREPAIHQEITRTVMINCWHRSDIESDAMWRLYAREKDYMAAFRPHIRSR